MADKSISYRFLGKDAGLGKTMSGLGDTSNHLHHTLGKLAGAFAGGLAGGAAVDFLKNSISDASDLNESLSKTRVVFGSASKGVEVFAKAAAGSLGQSTQQALEATSTFGNLFRALGIGTKPAADLSTKIVKLAGDLASFNNVDPAEALDALKSGLLGEAEPMRKFGVTLSAVRVQAEALADGLVKPTKDSGKVRTALLNVEVATRKLAEAQKGHGASTVKVEMATKKLAEAQKKYGAGSLEARAASDSLAQAQMAQAKAQQGQGPHSLAAKVAADNLARANVALAKATKGNVPALTAAQKAQASYNIIMKDTKTAQGDFGRTSGGLANQQRILKAELSNASAQLGTKLYPAATKVVTKLSEALQPGSKFSGILKDLGTRAKEFGDDAKPVFAWIGDHPDLFTQIAKDAVILGGVLKAKAFLTGLGLLKGAGGARLGAGLVGSAATRAAPIPVFVTNAGGLPGGKGAGAAGSAAAGAAGGGAVGTAEKVGAGALARRALAGPLGGVGSVLLTSGDEAIGDSGKQRRALGAQIEKLIGAKTARSVPSDLWGSAVGTAGKFGDSWKTKPNALAQYQILSQYGKGSDPALLAAMARLAASQAVRDYNADNDPQRAQRGQTRAMTLAAARTPAERLERITNNYYVTVNGLTLDQALAQAHRKARVHALGATNTPASRDRG